MADIAGTYTSPYTSPTFVHAISYSQNGRDSSSVTYAFTIQSHMTSSSSSFGYSLGWQVTINGQTFTGTIKNASPTWSGTTVYTTNFNVTVSCGTGGGTLGAELWVTRPGGEGNSGKIDTGSCTVSVSSWNTAPYWNGGSWCSASPSGTISEDTSSLTISWGGAGDTEGNTLYYTVKRYVNGSYSATIASGTTSTSCTDNIGTGNQGVQYYYSVEVNDGSLWANSTVWSNTVTKNTFTASGVSTSSSIAFSTTSIAFSVGGCSNTNGNTNFGYKLRCANVTVYNDQSTPSSVTIWNGSGSAPTGTYIKFADIKSATSSNNYTGTFTFYLDSWNAYGSSGTNSCTMWVDLRVSPTSFSVTGTGGYYTINSANYYVSNRQNPTVSWSSSTDQLGGSITYDIQVKLGNGGFYNVSTGLTGNSANVPIGGVNGRTSCTIRIIAKTSFGYTNQADSSSITLDYYNPPTITFTSLTRNINDMTVAGTVTINTSIPSITVTTLTYSGKTSGNLTLGTSFSKQETGLVETDAYTFSVTAQDGAGAVIGTSATTNSIAIPRYTPMLSVREKGVGVNALADDTYKFVIGGNAKITGNLNVNNSPVSLTYMGGVSDFNNALTEGGYNVGSGTSIPNAPYTGSIYGKLRVYVSDGGTHNNSNNWIWQYFDDTSGRSYMRYKVNSGSWTGWITNYSTANLNVTTSSTANSVVQRDGNGYINNSYYYTSCPQETSGATNYFYDDGSGYIRKKSLSNARNELVGGSMYLDASNALNYNISGNDLNNYALTGFARGSSMGNAVNSDWWYVTCQGHDAGTWATQHAVNFFNDNEYRRSKRNGTWSNWRRLLYDGDSATIPDAYVNTLHFSSLPCTMTGSSDGSFNFWFGNGWRMYFDAGVQALYRCSPSGVWSRLAG